MKTTISSKGQVVLPSPIRRKLGLRAGDPLEAKIERGHIVLTPKRARKRKGRIIKDALTGMPVLSFGPDAPVITSEMVAKLLEDFP